MLWLQLTPFILHGNFGFLTQNLDKRTMTKDTHTSVTGPKDPEYGVIGYVIATVRFPLFSDDEPFTSTKAERGFFEYHCDYKSPEGFITEGVLPCELVEERVQWLSQPGNG